VTKLQLRDLPKPDFALDEGHTACYYKWTVLAIQREAYIAALEEAAKAASSMRRSLRRMSQGFLRSTSSMDTDIHSCSMWCEKPGCIKAQRDQMRDEFAHPQVPLTEEEIDDIWDCTFSQDDPSRTRSFRQIITRALERAHGIGETK